MLLHRFWPTGEDLPSLLRDRIGIVVAARGEVTRVADSWGIFCVLFDGLKELWCRPKAAASLSILRPGQ